jgi:hypothetical protein
MIKTVHSLLATYCEPYSAANQGVKFADPNKSLPVSLDRPRLRMRGRIYLMFFQGIRMRFDWWRLRCTCLRCCLRIQAWRTSIYQSQRNPRHRHDALANALTRLRFLKIFLFDYDTSLVVGVLVATYHGSSGKSFLSYPLHLLRVMGSIVVTSSWYRYVLRTHHFPRQVLSTR